MHFECDVVMDKVYWQELKHKSQLVFSTIRAQLAMSSRYSLDVAWQACIRSKFEEILLNFDDFARSLFLRFLYVVLTFCGI